MDLQEGRRRIDAIDRQLLPLLEERMATAVEIGQYKKENGLPVYDPEREEAILAGLRQRVSPAYAEDAEQLYRLIFRLSRQHQGWKADE